MNLKRNYKMNAIVLSALFLILTGLVISGCIEKEAVKEPVSSEPSLYDRVGGINNIAVLIDDVIDRAYEDKVFAANPKIHKAHLGFPKPIYKFNATCLASMVMGGPHKYYGRSLADAHQHLDITEKEWTALINIFRDSMNSYNVAQKEQNEIIAILESTKGEVIKKNK